MHCGGATLGIKAPQYKPIYWVTLLRLIWYFEKVFLCCIQSVLKNCHVQWRKKNTYYICKVWKVNELLEVFVLKGISLWIQQLKRLPKFSTADLKILQLNKNLCSWLEVPVSNLKMITIFNFLISHSHMYPVYASVPSHFECMWNFFQPRQHRGVCLCINTQKTIKIMYTPTLGS